MRKAIGVELYDSFPDWKVKMDKPTCPKCGSTNYKERKYWTGMEYKRWWRCFRCLYRFDIKPDTETREEEA